MESKNWISSTLLSAAALSTLHSINRIYLDLLAANPSLRRVQPQSAPDPIGAGLARLSCERRLALACAPFSLFDAHFNDGVFWTQLAAAVHEPVPQDTVTGTIPFAASFTQMVLFYAWHLARLEPFAARVVLGMSPQTQQVLAGLSLPYLQQVALQEPQLIEPRWCDRDTVWRTFLGAAHCGPEHLAYVYLFGIQLSAGDLCLAQGKP